jgi:hypothetical protein
MKKYTFKWRETKAVTYEASIDELNGATVTYEPTGSDGIVVISNGEAFFKFDDMENLIPFDSKEGGHTLNNCTLFLKD